MKLSIIEMNEWRESKSVTHANSGAQESGKGERENAGEGGKCCEGAEHLQPRRKTRDGVHCNRVVRLEVQVKGEKGAYGELVRS